MNSGPAFLRRNVPLLAWVIVSSACLGIVWKVLGYGYVPTGDGRRHVAKAVTNKEYTDILVMRPGYIMDHSAGWEWLLRRLHRATGMNEDDLMAFAVGCLLLLILGAGLPWLRYPEAWLAALLALSVPLPGLISRWSVARPFLLTKAVLVCLLLAWRRDREQKPSWWKLLGTTAGFALTTWMHGAWYLYGLLLAAFFMARWWRVTIWLTVCWLAGSFLGACLTGKPIAYLTQALFIARSIQNQNVPTDLLVGELQPSAGEFSAILVLVVVWLWRKQRGKTGPDLFGSPLFWMMAICWVLALKAGRFWADWGLAAAMAWLAVQFDQGFREALEQSPGRRLMVCGLVSLALFLDTTSDINSRYTSNLQEAIADGSQPEMQGWMPDRDGIFYSADFSFFYNTFYKNPQGDWRYTLGFEPAMMPEEDLKIFRNIQWNHYAWEAYRPWVSRMRPEDRLEITCITEPELPPLEFHNAAGQIWIGRLPRKAQPKH